MVLDNWMAVTNFLAKAVIQALLLSGVTTFYSFSSDFKSSLMPGSALGVQNTQCLKVARSVTETVF